jgi:EAL domain-containing protein (putative c-di-GMP-specific phosphodiesterase class I)/GGDEF domain-containing protein
MTSVSSPIDLNSDYVDNLRRERDRFVALAFCAADVLFETEGNLNISYAAGATVALTGTAPEDIIGASLLDIITPADRPLIGELIRGMSSAKRLDPVSVHLLSEKGPTPPLLLTGYLLPDIPDSMFFALRLGSSAEMTNPIEEAGRDPATGLFQTTAFVRRASERLKTAQADGEDLNLTMVRLQDFADLFSRLDPEAGDMLLKTIAACLRVNAAPGETVGRFDDNNYGLVHKPDIDIADLQERIAYHLQTADPEGRGVEVLTGTVSTDVVDVPDSDLVKAVHYSIKRFCEEANAETAISSISENLHSQVHATSRKMTNFREIVSASSFDVAFQPIVEIITGKTSHFEALARFSGGSDRSPYELITFAENTGLICDFDFAMCRKLLDLLAETNRTGQRYKIAMNLSGRSVGNVAFLTALQDLLKEHGDLREQLIIEITESARVRDLEMANRFIQNLRASGHIVCLDDFGAGASALRYLHHLDVDVVKIDGQYIRGAQNGRKMRAFVKSIANLCTELDIVTIAEMVEDEAVIDILIDCGIQYGQGYYFGKPSAEISAFSPVRPRLGGAKPAAANTL